MNVEWRSALDISLPMFIVIVSYARDKILTKRFWVDLEQIKSF